MKSRKIIFIIPAYNEEMNIKKVLYDIRENASMADIIVINDCSKDNTEKILKEENVDYINHPFNMQFKQELNMLIIIIMIMQYNLMQTGNI